VWRRGRRRGRNDLNGASNHDDRRHRIVDEQFVHDNEHDVHDHHDHDSAHHDHHGSRHDGVDRFDS
jgi:hypothetical protein